MHRSQRTGLETWETIRSRTSRPSCTTVPSRLEMTFARGSTVAIEEASRVRWSTAGAMCSVWKAPATDSGINRVFSGGASARRSSCSTVPAATICPGPLSLAAVRSSSASFARTSSRSPPRMAVIDVGRCADALAIALPRSRTNTIACSALIAPTPAAAVISPTLWPAVAPTRSKTSAPAERAAAVTRPVPTSNGWATAVSRIVSASASVP